MSRRAVFFDRDDTLMVNVPYLGDPKQVEAFAEAAAAMAELQEAGFVVIVVSNQSGVGRGMITREQVATVNVELARQVGEKHIHAFYNSYATPDDPAPSDRKPSPQLLFTAAKEHDLDLAKSFFVGDRLSDIECGIAAGCRTVLLTHVKSSRRGGNDPKDAIARKKADHIAENLHEAVAYILTRSGAAK
jgi:D-glycero-D-manno-heptose 1,7-bisphosphate phosphatase